MLRYKGSKCYFTGAPPAMKEKDVKKLIKFLKDNSDVVQYAVEEYAEYCCADEGLEDGYNNAVKTIGLAYGVMEDKDVFPVEDEEED